MIKVNPRKSRLNLSAPEEKKGTFEIGKVEMFFHETQLRIQPLGEEQYNVARNFIQELFTRNKRNDEKHPKRECSYIVQCPIGCLFAKF